MLLRHKKAEASFTEEECWKSEVRLLTFMGFQACNKRQRCKLNVIWLKKEFTGYTEE